MQRLASLGFLWVLLLSACAPQPRNTPQITQQPLVALTQGMNTCADLVSAALAQPACEGALCYVTVEFNPQSITENVLSRAALDIAQTNGLPVSFIPLLAESARWTRYTVRGADFTLLLVGELALSGMTPTLDTPLTLFSSGSTPACEGAPPPMLLIQAADGAQPTLTLNGVTLSPNGTIQVWRTTNTLEIATLEGLTAVSAQGVTRIVRDGNATRVTLVTDAASEAPLPAEPVSRATITAQVLATLPRALTISTLPVEAQIEQLQQGGECTPNPTWQGRYTVQRGDTLARIAPLYALNVAELQAANCITNPNRLSVGQILYVPAPAPTATTDTAPLSASPTSAPVQTLAPLVTAPAEDTAPIRTDAQAPLTAGACTQLYWNAPNAVSVFLDEQPVPLSGSQQVCPTVTTVYTLRTVNINGESSYYTAAVLITVD